MPYSRIGALPFFVRVGSNVNGLCGQKRGGVVTVHYMDIIIENWNRGIEQLFGRTDGFLVFRLFIMPVVSSIIGIRAAVRDFQEKGPALFYNFFAGHADKKRILSSGWKDVGRIIIVALVLDAVYQIITFRAFYIFQAMMIAFLCAFLPYIFFRHLTNRLARMFTNKDSKEM